MSPPSSSPTTTTTTKQILIADDDEIGRRAIRRILEREGYICHEAHSGDEALKTLSDTAVDLLIADIKMQGNNRLELLQYLRSRSTPIPVILITGYASIETAVAATSLNAVAYLLKPLDTDNLLKVVREEFNRRNVFDLLRQHRKNLEENRRLMLNLESTFARGNRGATTEALESYISLSFDQMIESMLDLKVLMESSVTKQNEDNISRRLYNSRPLILISAIQETIQTLDRTRNSFKSKELAILRHKLEALLSVSASPSSDSSNSFQRAPGSIPPISATPFNT